MILYKVIGAFIAIFSFAIMLETPKKYLAYAGLVSAIGWCVYLLAVGEGSNEVLATFLSALAIAFVSQIFARIFKIPVTVFLVAGILPTVPGAGMYRIVYYFIQNDMEMASHYLALTLELAGALAVGIFFIDALFRVLQKGKKQKSLHYSEKMIDKKGKIV